MVSGGGGAEFVSDQEARAAIQRGEHIAIEDTGSLLNLGKVKLERPPTDATPSHLILLAYRQAGTFVTFLHDADGQAFARTMDAILDGRPFGEAVTAGYHEDVHSLCPGAAPRRHEHNPLHPADSPLDYW
jgi:hypothetical protein